MAAEAKTNRDLLPWFSEEERSRCGVCAEPACVTLPRAKASFCLACGAITIDGVRLDRNGRLDHVA